MIGIDTNILARVILDDDVVQSATARKVLSVAATSGGVFVPRTVVAELAWLLRVKKRTRSEIATVIAGLLDTAGLSFADAPLLASALEMYRRANVSFEDCLIVAECTAAGTPTLLTFDADLQRADSRCQPPTA